MIEGKLKRVSEFFSQVVLAFVFQDIGLMLVSKAKGSGDNRVEGIADEKVERICTVKVSQAFDKMDRGLRIDF